MTDHFHASRFLQTRSVDDEQARFERCEETAGWYFANATKTQAAAFHRAMADLKGLSAPRYDRARDAAKAAFEASTKAASELCEETVRELMQTGDVSEALSYRWDELDVATAMMEVA